MVVKHVSCLLGPLAQWLNNQLIKIRNKIKISTSIVFNNGIDTFEKSVYE